MSGTEMAASHGHSKACCNLPPVIVEGYEPKGTYETIDGMKTYVTGPSSAQSAILFVFDIFGFFPQTLQGADILATSGKHHNFQVFMPDFLDGNPCDIEIYPPDTPQKKKDLGAFFEGRGAPPKSAAKVPALVEAIKKHNPNLKSFGIVGFCWGGKIVSLSVKGNSTFSAAAECHPAMVDPSEAEQIDIPMCMLASGDEPAEDVKKFEAALKGPKHVETFGDQIHGWMGARGDLNVERNKSEYERGYKTLIEFFTKYLNTSATQAKM